MPGTGSGEPGDLYLIIQVSPHHLFEQKGDDLRLKLNVPLTTTALGGEVEVPALNGKLQNQSVQIQHYGDYEWLR